MGPVEHNGKESYLDEETYFDAGQSYAERTATMIAQILIQPETMRSGYLERYQGRFAAKLWRGLQAVKSRGRSV